MPKLRNALLCLAAVPAIALAQNSGSLDLLNFAPSDAQILAGANVTAAKNSPFGQFVLAQMQSGDSHFQTFITETGFDPRTDLSEVLLATTGAPGKSSTWLIAAHGSFSHVMTTLEGKLAGDGAMIAHLPGVDVLTLPAENGANSPVPCVAFFTDGYTAVMGECSTVNAAAQSNGAKSSLSGPLATKARQWRTQDDFWFTSVLPLTQFAAGLPNSGPLPGMMNTEVFKAIQQTSGGVKFASSSAQGAAIQASGEVVMDTPQSAASLLNVVNFISGMIQNIKVNDPAASLFASLFAGLQASASANTVSVNLTIPEGTLEQIITAGPHAAMLH
jgi:hypothetical protein